MDKLKPCPFCGNEAVFLSTLRKYGEDIEEGDPVKVVCSSRRTFPSSCLVEPELTVWFAEKENAAEAWNRRL